MTRSSMRLKQGDERVFTELVERWSGMMLRVALSHLDDHAVAEDVVQDAWLTVLRSLDRFERRSALRTWVVGIVVNLARSRARAGRSIGVPSDPGGPAIDSARFLCEPSSLAAPLGPGTVAVADT